MKAVSTLECVNVREKEYRGKPEAEKTTENFAKRFPKKKDVHSFPDLFSGTLLAPKFRKFVNNFTVQVRAKTSLPRNSHQNTNPKAE